jgi:hypothetical protein
MLDYNAIESADNYGDGADVTLPTKLVSPRPLLPCAEIERIKQPPANSRDSSQPASLDQSADKPKKKRGPPLSHKRSVRLQWALDQPRDSPWAAEIGWDLSIGFPLAIFQ